MRLPIDTHGLQFLAVAAPERLVRYEEGKPREAWQPRTNEQGELLYAVRLCVMGDEDEADLIRVTVVGEPKVQKGTPVEVSKLTALPWEMGEKSGVAFRAERITPIGGERPAPAKPGS